MDFLEITQNNELNGLQIRRCNAGEKGNCVRVGEEWRMERGRGWSVEVQWDEEDRDRGAVRAARIRNGKIQ